MTRHLHRNTIDRSDVIIRQIEQVLSFAGASCTIVLKERVTESTAAKLLALPGLVSVVVGERSADLASRFPERVGWFETDGVRPRLPNRLGRQIVYLGFSWEFGLRATRQFWIAGARRLRCVDDPRRPFYGQRMLLVLARRFVASLLYRTGIYSRFHGLAYQWTIRRVERQLTGNIAAPLNPIPGRLAAVTGSLGPGGSEGQLAGTLIGLAARGWEDITLLHERFMHPPNDFHLSRLKATPVVVEQLVPLHLHDLDKWSSDGQLIKLLALNGPLTDLGSRILAYVLEFKRIRPEVVHTWLDEINVSAGLAAAVVGVPHIVLSCRSLNPENFAFFRPYMRPLYRALVRLPNIVMLNNSDAGARDYERWLGLSEGKVRVVHNGFDFSSLLATAELNALASAVRSRLGIAGDAKVIGTVMRFSEEKRPLLWLEAAAAVHASEGSAQFLVVGDGSMREEIEAAIKQYGLSHAVHLVGYQEHIAASIAAMDVFLLTSRVEGLPNVLIEAQTLGVPVVTTLVGGVAETFQNGVTGLAVNEASGPALAAALLAILRDSHFMARTRELAPTIARDRFSLDQMLEGTLRAYGPRLSVAAVKRTTYPMASEG